MATKTASGKSGMNAAWQKKLKGVQKHWKGAHKESKELGGFTQLDDGNYVGRLTDMKIDESSSGNLHLITELTVVKGENTGETVRKFDSLEREEGLPYLIRYLESLGAENIEDLDLANDLPALCKEFKKTSPYVRFKLRTKDEFQNVFIQKLLDDVEEDEAPKKGKGNKKPESSGDDDDDNDEKNSGKEKDSDKYIPSKGDSVKFTGEDGEEKTGTVVSYNEETEDVKIKTDDGEKVTLDVSEVSPEEEGSGDDDDNEAPPKGAKVKVMIGSKEKKGKVIAVDEEDKRASVKVFPEGNIKEFPFSEIEVIVEGEDD